MKLSHDEVRHIAKLARLGLSEKEVEKFSVQLSDILSYAKILDEVNVDGVEPIAQITGLKSVMFEDQVQGFDDPDALLKQSPNPVVSHMIKVKNVFE